ALLVAAPAAAQETSTPAGKTPADAVDTAGSPEFRVGAGDVLQVDVWQEPKISGRFEVGSVGAIEHPLLGPVKVSGKTAGEIANSLKAALAGGYLKDPRVAVRVVEFRSFRVSVVGGVRSPGIYFLKGPSDLISLILLTGGFE